MESIEACLSLNESMLIVFQVSMYNQKFCLVKVFSGYEL